jgi:hypothetical protein
MGCVQAWSAHGDLWWRNLYPSLASYRVGREIKRYKREREEEMREEQGGIIDELLV